MHRATLPLAFCFLLTGFEGTLAAQAVAETALGAARAATTTAAAAGSISKSVNGVAGAIDKTLRNATGSQSSPAAGAARTARPAVRKTTAAAKTTAAPAPAPAPKPAPNYEDPKQIQAGMTYDEVIRRFGPPALEITSGPGASSLNYSSKEGAVQVEMQDGKVASVEKPKS